MQDAHVICLQLLSSSNRLQAILSACQVAEKTFSFLSIDALAKTRHTRESGYPGFIKVVEIPGFPFSRE
jgi:hypothetical protein